MSLLECLRQARQRRAQALSLWAAEETDSYRLFHGVAEGRPGLTVDRYGPVLLAQVTATLGLSSEEEQALGQFLQESGGVSIIALRQGPALVLQDQSASGLWESTFWCRELGLEFAVNLSVAHRDPQLFLDFRAAKRRLRQILPERSGASVLNLFSYTCSVSCHAARAGAGEVWSVDFSGGNLAWGRKNFRRNRLPGKHEFLEEDCIGLLWALTGRRIGRKGLRTKVAPRQFSVVVADPPAWSKGKFAAVDMVRDPETVLGPSWDAVAPGGILLAANNSARISRSELEGKLLRLFEKRGGLVGLEWIDPDPDFPSFDGEPPLKVALCRKN